MAKPLIFRLKEILLRNVGDNRKCPKCGHSFIPDDTTSKETYEIYKEIR